MDDRNTDATTGNRLPRLTRYTFGNRWLFAVECEVQECERDPWGSLEPFGSFWLWVEGRIVGNPHATEQLVHAFTPLAEIARNAGNRPDSRLERMTNLDKLNLVMWARFGEDEEFDAEKWGAQDIEYLRDEGLEKYEVIWRGYSPFSDGWEAILTEQETTETLIWRQSGERTAEVHEASLRRGLCSEVATLACSWFEPLRAERIRPELADPKTEVQLVKRVSNDRANG